MGPPYSIHSIEPKISPVTGGTRCVVRGMGFSDSGGEPGVAVACPRGAENVSGTILSDTEMFFITPDYRKFGPAQDVQSRLKIGNNGLTNGAVELKLFEVSVHPESHSLSPL